jgi:hypothetical protein
MGKMLLLGAAFLCRVPLSLAAEMNGSSNAKFQPMSRAELNNRFGEAMQATLKRNVEYLDVMGEGPGAWDEYPRYAAGDVNCMTWVQLLIAEIYSKGLEDKTPVMDRIRYYDGNVGFSLRKHFVDQWVAFDPGPLKRVVLPKDAVTEHMQVEINTKHFVDYHKFACPLFKMDQTKFEWEYVPRLQVESYFKKLPVGYYIMFAVASETYIKRFGKSSGPMGLVHAIVVQVKPSTNGSEPTSAEIISSHASTSNHKVMVHTLASYIEEMQKPHLGYVIYELDPNWDYRKTSNITSTNEVAKLLECESKLKEKRVKFKLD